MFSCNLCKCLKRAWGRKYEPMNVSNLLPASICSRRIDRNRSSNLSEFHFIKNHIYVPFTKALHWYDAEVKPNLSSRPECLEIKKMIATCLWPSKQRMSGAAAATRRSLFKWTPPRLPRSRHSPQSFHHNHESGSPSSLLCIAVGRTWLGNHLNPCQSLTSLLSHF